MTSDEAAARIEHTRSALRAQAPPPDGTAPALQAGAPLRQVSPAVQTRMVGRVLAGRTPLGADHPRRGLWWRTVAPLAVVAALDSCGIGLALGRGNTSLAVATIVIFVLIVALVIAGARFALHDPLRFTAAQRREIAAAQTWTSRRQWDGALATSVERGLLVAATQAAGRIVASPTLASPTLDPQRARLDLAAELDELDTLAHQAAQRAPADGDPDREAVLTRAAALTCYADDLDRIAARTPAGKPDINGVPRAPNVSADEALRLAAFLEIALGSAPRDSDNR